ncbi:MAG TPA: carotenoid biosynthesis protein [bacterium]|nr:carotenoid biosynthesis protein [bacterium]HPR87418.1 carotenoid biosynthesis protein [bacterium]
MRDRKGGAAAQGERGLPPGGRVFREHGEGLAIFLLYFLLAAGGLWNLLGWFQELMRLLAAPLLIALAILLAAIHARRQAAPRRALLSYAGVVVSSFLLEWLGVTTGKVFGPYRYGEVLQPQLFGVPLAIGFAWLGMLISAAAVADGLMQRLPGRSPWVQVVFTAVLMLVFDAVMEPAAVRLDYWQWQGNLIPPQNYVAWFLFSLFYSAAAWRLGLFRNGLPAFCRHAWLAQLFYFLLVRLGHPR